MQAIREIVSRDIFKGYDIPKEFGNEFEMILVPLNDVVIDERKEIMRLQEENGFSQTILAQESEDVWNDI